MRQASDQEDTMRTIRQITMLTLAALLTTVSASALAQTTAPTPTTDEKVTFTVGVTGTSTG